MEKEEIEKIIKDVKNHSRVNSSHVNSIDIGDEKFIDCYGTTFRTTESNYSVLVFMKPDEFELLKDTGYFRIHALEFIKNNESKSTFLMTTKEPDSSNKHFVYLSEVTLEKIESLSTSLEARFDAVMSKEIYGILYAVIGYAVHLGYL